MMCKYLITFLLLIWSGTLLGQSTIVGIVVANGLPIESASISLLRFNDSSALSTQLTDQNGEYVFKAIPEGAYLINVSSIGYHNFYSSKVEIYEDSKTIFLDTISLSAKNIELKDIVIRGAKKRIKAINGGFTVDVANSPNALGSAVDLLRFMPFVSVSSGGKVSLRSKKTLILINGIPVLDKALSDILSTIPANEVSKIELITEPSEKYDASYGSVINIITTRKNKGLTGTIRATGNVGKSINYGFSGNLSYSDSSIYIYTNIGYNRSNEWYYEWGNRAIFSDNSKSTLLDSTVRDFGSDIYFIRPGVSLKINKNNTIGFLMNGSITKTNGENRTQTLFKEAALMPDSSLFTSSKMHNHRTTFDYNLNYHFTSNLNKNDIQALITYTPVSKAPEQIYTPVMTNYITDSTYNQNRYRTMNVSKYNILVFQSDYTQRLAKDISIQAGVKIQTANTRNSLSKMTQLGQEYIIDTAFSNNFEFVESIYGVYGSISKSWDKLYLSTGIRMEDSRARFHNDSLLKVANMFPHIYIKWKLPSDRFLSFNYNKEISRPPYEEILPYTMFYDQYTIFKGNPSLKPSYDNVFTVSYRDNGFNVSLYYSSNKNYFSQLPIKQDIKSKVTYYSTINLAKSISYGIDGLYSNSFTHWWTSTNTISFSYSSSTGEVLNNQTTLSLLGYNLSSNNTFKFSDRLSASISGYYYSTNNDGLSKSYGYGNINAYFQMYFFEKKVELHLGLRDILRRNIYKTSSHFGIYSDIYNSTQDSRKLSLEVAVHFGHSTKKASKPSLGNEKALMRIK